MLSLKRPAMKHSQHFKHFPAKRALALLALSSLIAEAAELHSHTLGKSVVTGSAIASDVEKLPGSVSVADSKHIQNMPNNKITDSIKGFAGVRVDNDVGFNPRPKIKIRGINYGTLIMLDGVILSDLEGENRILNQISLYDVERVEVARGAFSSLYGAGAIGGVVNFITAMPSSFSSQALVGYGSEFVSGTADKNLVRAYASVGDAFLDKRLRVKLSAGYSGSGGYSSFPALLPSGVNTSGVGGITTDKAGNQIIGTGGNRAYNIYDVRLKAEYDITDSSTISSMLSFSNHNYSFGGFKSQLVDKNSGLGTDLIGGKDYFVGSGLGGMGSYSHLVGNLAYTQDFGESMLKISFSTMNLFSQWQDANVEAGGDRYGGAGTTQDIDSTSNYLDILYHIDLSEKHHLATAAQFRYYDFTQLNRNMTNWRDYATRTDTYRSYGGKAAVASAYVSLDSAWSDSFATSIGGRYDYWQNFDGYLRYAATPQDNRENQGAIASIFSPKIGATYTPENLGNIVFKSSLGSGFRMPTMRDMYQFSHSVTQWEINPNLKQERALSFDVGVEYQGERLVASLYYYDTELWDMIYRSGNGKANDPYKNINAGRGRIHGVELSSSVGLWEDLRLEGSYTLTLATILKNNARPESVGNQLANTPKHMANLALNYLPKRGFFASLWAYYAPAFYADDIGTSALSRTYGYYESQFTLNSKLGYAFDSGVELSAQFNNMTNNRYYDFYQVAGASYYVQLRYKY